MICFVVSVVIFNVLVVNHLTAQVDARLNQWLTLESSIEGHGGGIHSTGPSDADSDDVPIYTWRVLESGSIAALTVRSPTLPEVRWTSRPVTLTIGYSHFRFLAVRDGKGWLVAGSSLAQVTRIRSLLVLGEIVSGAVLLVLMFGAAYAVGIRSLAPVAIAQRRRAEFTADASHELRTPLSVIEAEVAVALSRDRDASSYREALERVGGESQRLRRIVDDLLWLARADGAPRNVSGSDVTDIASVARQCAERFLPVAQSKQIELAVTTTNGSPAFITGTKEILDRLVGVLVDNACKFTEPGGKVEVLISVEGNRVILRVDDSGPGVPESERPFVFDRFHRSTTPTGGTGLGLAIADSIVKSSHATCIVGSSPSGGARFEVTWKDVSREVRSMPSVS